MGLPEEDAEWGRLVDGTLEGDPRAARRLDRALRPFVRRRLRESKRRRNWFWIRDLEETTADVLAQFYEALTEGRFTYEGRARLEGFLVRTTFFVAMNLKDLEVKHRAVSLDGDDEQGGIDVEAYLEAPDVQVARRDCLQELARAISGLNENRRDVVERTLAGQKVREICAATGRSPASVSGLKFNAFKDLRAALEEGGFVERCGSWFGVAHG